MKAQAQSQISANDALSDSITVLNAVLAGNLPVGMVARQIENNREGIISNTLVIEALRDLLADAKSMDARLLVGQPNPGCVKGSIARAESILSAL